MSHSTNLVAERDPGPSVWDRMDRQQRLRRFGSSLITTGLALLAAGLAFRLPAIWRPVLHSKTDDAIDQASADSFPASDPPAM